VFSLGYSVNDLLEEKMTGLVHPQCNSTGLSWFAWD